MIPFFKNYFDKSDIEYVTRVISRGMHWANGPENIKLEEYVKDLIGSNYCLAFNSGTSALHSILLAYDIKDSEVIVPSFTFISTANSVLMANGRVVFADIEDETFGLDPEDVKEKITSKTKAIMPVHYGGCSCKIKELKELAEDHKLILIEDAAESIGAKFYGQMVGSFGEAAMFSFTPSKIISTGEGGVLVIDSKDIYEKLKLLRSHGRLETEDYFTSSKYMDYITLGYNFRIPTICAAQGMAQMEKLDNIIAMRKKIADFYNQKLIDCDEIRLPSEPDNYFHIYQMYSILIKEGKEKRDGLIKYLNDNGISSKIYFFPVHKTHFYRQELGFEINLAKTEEVADTILSIPLYPDLTEDQQHLIVEKVYEYFD